MKNHLKPSGHMELDSIRMDIKTDKTSRGNYKLRLFMLKQWMCTLQQMGSDTSAFLDVSEVFKATFPWNLFEIGGKEKILNSEEEELVFPAIDEGYKILDEIYSKCNQLGKEPAAGTRPTSDPAETVLSPAKPKAKDKNNRPEDWPLYQKNIQHTGSMETNYSLSGNEAWKFPIGFAWEAQPVIENDIVYATSPGMRTIMYSFDLNTGKELWSAKQLPAIVVDQLYWTPCAASTPQIQDNNIIVRNMGSRGNKGDARYAVVMDKKTGVLKKRIETGHVDYRAGYAPLAADKKYIVFPHGIHDIEGSPPVCQPFNRLICRNIESGEKAWEIQIGPTLCEPVIHGNTVLTGTMDGNVFCFDLETEKNGASRMRWQFQTGGGVNKSPGIKSGKVYFGSNDGNVYCLSEKDGSLIWTTKTDQPENRSLKNFTTPLCANGKVYIGSADHFLYCLNEDDGSLEWKFKSNDWLRSRPVISGKKIYIITVDGNLCCLSGTGRQPELLWSKKVGMHHSYADLVSHNGKILVTTSDLFLWCFNEKGDLLWKKSLLECAYDGEHRIWLEQVAGGAYFQSKVTAADGKIFFGTPSRFIYGVDAYTGKECWKFELGAAVSVAPSYSNGRIFAGQQGGEEYFYCIDAQTGQKIWQQSIGWVWGSCSIAKGKVFIPCIDGYAVCLDEKSGAVIWRYRTNKSLCTEPTIDDDTVYFGGWDQFMYAFDMHTGKIKWSRYFDKGSDSGSQIAHKGKLYFPCPGSQFRCLDSKTGNVEWNIHIDKSNFNVTPAFHDNKVFASAMIGRCLGGIAVGCNVYCIDLDTREILWTHPGAGHTAPIAAGGKVYFGSLASPYIYCVNEQGDGDGTTKCHWKFRMGNRVEESCGAWYDNKLYMLNSGGYLYAIK
ncbi:MAG: PQQ-binding-like beta-propeller repeat protein [Bacteroidetes bacterium]|nr:PQQ-binding-like beta-propeller repeat protein [Bacteroidota bacterium]